MGFGDFGFEKPMPINRKNTDPQTYSYYLIVGDQIAKQLIVKEEQKYKELFEKQKKAREEKRKQQ